MENPAAKPSLLSRIFSWRMARRMLIGLGGLITLLALFHVEENWRGKRTWENYRHELEAKGESFDIARSIPPAVPDEQNFALTPALAPLCDFLPGTQTPRDTNASEHARNFSSDFDKHFPSTPSKTRGGWAGGRATDLIGDAHALVKTRPALASMPRGDRKEAATLLLQGLDEFKPFFDEIQTASKRPYSRFNVKYDWDDKAAILLPHLAVVKRMVVILQLRASAELALGQTDAAFTDVNLMFYVTDSIQSETFLISHLVRLACLNIVLQPVWEGFNEHLWSDAQAEAIGERLRKFDFFDDEIRCMHADVNFFGNSIFERVRGQGVRGLDYLFQLGNNGIGIVPGQFSHSRKIVGRCWLFYAHSTWMDLFGAIQLF